MSLLSPVMSLAQDTIEIQPGTTISNTGLIEVLIFNANPHDLKIKAEYGEDDFHLKSNLFYFDDSGYGTATLSGLQSGQTYQYRLFDTTEVLSPTDTFTFTAYDWLLTYQSYPISNSPSGSNSFPNTPNPANNSTNSIPLGGTPSSSSSANTNTSSSGASSISTNSSTDYSKGLVPCDNTPDPDTGIIPDTSKCDFNQLMALVNKIINFILFGMAIPIAAIMFAYAGFLLITAGGGEAKTKAKGIFTNAVLGLLLAAAAWLIVSTILSILGYEGAWIGLKIGS